MAANNIYIQVDLNSQSAQSNVNALNAAIASTGPTAAKSSQQATTGLNSVSVSVQQVNREFSQLTSAIAGLGISRAIAGFVQMSAELSRTKLAMQSFTGSAQEANKVFEQIRAIAATSPFRFKDLEETGQRLLGFGMAAKNVPDTLKVITDQVARMGGSIEGVNTIVTVFGRVMEKNFVGAMDVMRALPAQGVPALKALGDQMEKELHRTVDVEEVRDALKKGILDPLQFIRVQLDAMRQKGDAGKFSDDAARAFKNLGDSINNAIGELFGPHGFGPALARLANEIGTVLAPLAVLIEKLEKLPESTKDAIVEVVAAAAAFAALSTALGIVVNLAGPLYGLTASIAKFGVTLVAANPEVALFAALLGGLAFALYKTVPEIQKFVDDAAKTIKDKLTSIIGPLQEEGKKFMASIFGGGDAIAPDKLINTDALFATLQEAEAKHAGEAAKTMLEALSSPVEAVQAKYNTLFQELEEKMRSFTDESQKAALRGILGSAETTEMQAAQFKLDQKAIDERTKYDEEKVKGSYDAQIAYIQAMDAKDLNSKVAAIDKVTDLRIASVMQVAKIQDDALQKTFDAQEEQFRAHRYEMEAMGIDVDKAIQERQAKMVKDQQLVDQKATDESQKYRLEGWKKANDAIIEDQKRVFDAFKSQFDQLFDAFTSKSPGKAIADVFRKMALGEAKDLFSSTAAAGATAAAGYGVPVEEIGKGGILGQLLKRGMPPRAPGAPPDAYLPTRSDSTLNYDAQGGANRFATSTATYDTATMRFAVAVKEFSSSGKGSADRMMGDGDDAAWSAYAPQIRQREASNNYSAQSSTTTASGAYQIIDSTWAEAARGTGLGREFAHAKDAPANVQDANANWLYKTRGLKPWAASGPYGTGGGGQSDADFLAKYGLVPMGGGAAVSTQRLDQLYGQSLGVAPYFGAGAGGAATQNFTPAPWAGGGSTAMDAMMSLPTTSRMGPMPDLYTGPTTSGGLSMDEMNSLPFLSRMNRGLPGLFGQIGGGGGINPGQLTAAGTKMVSDWKKMLGFSAPSGTGSADATDAGGSFSLSGLATSPLAKAGAGMLGGLLANRGLLGPDMGTGGGILEGTLGGAGVGFAAGGALGAGIGAAAGLGIGIGEMLAGVESPRNQAKRLANQLYHIAINNSTADQIVSLAQSSYGGSVSRAMRAPEVRHMLGLFAAGTGQSFAQGVNEPHGASVVESGGQLLQQQTYQYGRGYAQSSNLPTYGGGSPSVLGAPGGLSLSLNIGGQDAAKFMTGQVVTPDVVQNQYAAAMNGSSGRVAQALMMSEPGSIAT